MSELVFMISIIQYTRKQFLWAHTASHLKLGPLVALSEGFMMWLVFVEILTDRKKRVEVRKHAQQVTVAKKEKESFWMTYEKIQLWKAINNSELTQVDLSPRLIMT